MRLGGGALVVIVVASLIFGVNPLEMIGMLEGGGATARRSQDARPPPGYGPQRAPRRPPPRAPPARRRIRQRTFVAPFSSDTEDVWEAVFKTMGAQYEPPRLVLFHGATRSACGGAPVGAPDRYYCSADRTSSTSTPRSSTSCRAASARPAISPRLT